MKNIDGGQKQGEEEVRVLQPLSYMSGNLKKKMEEVLGCRFFFNKCIFGQNY